MSNILSNGTVLPSGLLSGKSADIMSGFQKTYQNTALRVGVIVETYDIASPKNLTKLVPEYDVLVFEQNEDRGATAITYKNCLSSSSLGSIADFFEANLRKIKNKKAKGKTPTINGQNGSIVLLLCLDGNSDKGIIVGALSHPDRKTTLKDEGPRLEAEYNGVNIKVEKDGSTTLTFRGATDNDGNVIDSSQGNTVLSIETDGTYQVKHKSITQRLEKSGKASLNALDNIDNTTNKNYSISAQGNVNIKAAQDLSVQADNLLATMSGSAMLQCQKMQINSEIDFNVQASQIQIQAESLANIKATNIILEGGVSLGGSGGQPLLLLSTQMVGIGNLGIPVISNAISGFTTQVTAL